MYSIQQIFKGIRQPKKIIKEIEDLCGKIQNNWRGCAIIEEDWDNLLILDACRYDMFKKLNTIDGELEHRRSKGSATWEFSKNNFAGKEFLDTVYVNGNPNVSVVASETFHELRDVWRTDWNDEYGTVMPETMQQRTIEAANEYPNKRIVAHFMQPHHPFLGPTAARELGDLSGNEASRLKALSGNGTTESSDEASTHIWSRFERGDTELSTIKEAYYETLDQALPHVERLCSQLQGKTVVTSDHGNLLGEQAHPWIPWKTQRFAHPDYSTAEALVKVPWLICENGSRRRITSDPPKERAEYNKEVLNEKLESLGYKG
jgi:hypothetical protein